MINNSFSEPIERKNTREITEVKSNSHVILSTLDDESTNKLIVEMQSSKSESNESSQMLDEFNLVDPSNTDDVVNKSNSPESTEIIEKSQDKNDARELKDNSTRTSNNSVNENEILKEHTEESLQAMSDNFPDFMPQRMNEIETNMDKFEERRDTGDISQKDVSNTYLQVDRILNSESKTGISNLERFILADNILENAASPQGIDQGSTHTCTVTALEAKTYEKSPATAAELVADVALEGIYNTSYQDPSTGSTKLINVDTGTEPFGDAELYPSPDGSRNFASQLFQVTVVNMGLETMSPNLKYTQEEPQNPSDTGERFYSRKEGGKWALFVPGVEAPPDNTAVEAYLDPLYHSSKEATLSESPTIDQTLENLTKPSEKLPDGWQYNFQPNLTMSNLALLDQILNKHDDPALFGSHAETTIPENANDPAWKKLIQDVPDESTLVDILNKANKEKNFPILVGVDGSKGIFSEDSATEVGGPVSGHVLSINGILKDSAGNIHVLIDNQWGDKNDHLRFDKGIPVSKFYEAILRAD